MRRRSAQTEQVGRLAERVLSSSGAMVGACATLVGLVKVIEPRRGVTHVDEYAGLTAVAFVISALLAYLTLRADQRPALQARLELVADIVFLGAMVALAVIGVMFAYDAI